MQHNMETQHKLMFCQYIVVFCDKVVPVSLYLNHEFTGICEILNAMKYSFELCFLKGRKEDTFISSFQLQGTT